MSDAAYIELPPEAPKKSFFRSWRAVVLLLFIAAVILAGCFSWWLAQGRLSSLYARVDTIVFTVEPEIPSRLDDILVNKGENVLRGQALAHVNADLMAPAVAPSFPQDQGFARRLSATQEMEKKLVGQLARARAEEERYQKIHHDRVTEHVSSLLALRSIDPRNELSYQQAVQNEANARHRMQLALEDFEKVSKGRAAMEVELDRIRGELFRKKQRRARSVDLPAPEPAKAPAPPRIETLYAPVSGTILDINAGKGQILHPGQPVFLIMPSDNSGVNDMWIQAWFAPTAATMLKVGQKAQIKAGSVHITGTVSEIAAAGQYGYPADASGRSPGAQYLPVRIQADNEGELAKLGPGTKVNCQIQTRYVPWEGLF